MGFQDGKHFLVQREKYANRAEKFLFLGAASVVATMGAIVAAPLLGALAIPALVATSGVGYVSLAGFGANKIAENTTDAYEPHSKREKFKNAIS
ncbi:hypothetical protein [Delftia acidovorans]|uniref:hypothetical protein n=1 Tax=Delftia acidovorans TaxID=80866 RepID=UPI002430DB1A|nr:hypothetical protein [Delftia acidovorans]